MLVCPHGQSLYNDVSGSCWETEVLIARPQVVDLDPYQVDEVIGKLAAPCVGLDRYKKKNSNWISIFRLFNHFGNCLFSAFSESKGNAAVNIFKIN